jgi:4-hydroxybenzoate polyprenyltransferase
MNTQTLCRRPNWQSMAVRALYATAHSGILIGLAGAGVMTAACLLLGGFPSLRLLGMAFCVSTSSYAVDRIADLRRDTHLERTRALQQLRGFGPVSLLLFGVAVVLGLTSERPLSGVLTLVFPLSVALYSLPWMRPLSDRFGYAGVRRIKDVPLAKAFYVPACWTLLVLWAAPFFPAARPPQILFAMVFLFPSLFITAAACDLRDERADRDAGILTFPVLLGRRRTIAMLSSVQVASMAIFSLLAVVGLVPSVAAILALSGVPVLLCLGRLARPDANLVIYGDVVFDLLWVFQPLPAVAVTLLLGSSP